jgi:hypothetical protein
MLPLKALALINKRIFRGRLWIGAGLMGGLRQSIQESRFEHGFWFGWLRVGEAQRLIGVMVAAAAC